MGASALGSAWYGNCRVRDVGFLPGASGQYLFSGRSDVRISELSWCAAPTTSGNWRALAAFWLIVVVAALNPVLDRYEVALSGTPENYVPVSPMEPYAMTASAWQRLSLAQQLQEGSEMLLLVVVLQLFH